MLDPDLWLTRPTETRAGEKQGEAQQAWGETKDKAEDVKDKVDDRL